jgi:transcriptional regulator with XRE-family HTH domain
MTIGDLIRTRRIALGMSLRDVAGITGMSPSTLSRIERGLLEPGICLCASLSRLLRVSLRALADAAMQ